MSEINVEGMDELISRLASAGRNVDIAIDDALKEVAENIKDEMQKLVPVSDINHLHIKDDIKVSDIIGEGTGKKISVGPSKKTSWRAKFIEFGTSKIKESPFIEPAHLNTKAENMEIIKQKIREALEI